MRAAARIVAGPGRIPRSSSAPRMNENDERSNPPCRGERRLPVRGRRDGRADAVAGLGLLADRAGRRLVPEPQDRRADHARLALRHVAGLGAGPDVLLQRRLRPDDPWSQASLGAGPAGTRGLAGDLGRYRPPCRVGDPHRAGDVGRRPAPFPRASGVPGGDLSHLLLQPRTRRRGRGRGDALRGHGGHAADHRRASAADAPRAGGPHRGGREVGRGCLPSGRRDAGRESP